MKEGTSGSETMETLAESRHCTFQAVVMVEMDDGRMYPLVDNSPKCLLPVANRKLLAYQLDMLAKSGVSEAYIVSPQEYKTPMTQFLAEYMRESIVIDLVCVEDMMGSADGLRAVGDRLRGDFIYMSSEVFCKGGLGELTNIHRLKGGDVTMMLATAPVEEGEKKGGKKKLKIEEEDQEFIVCNDEQRVLTKIPKADAEEDFSLSKPLLNHGGNLSLRSDLLDIGVYCFSYWIIELLHSNRKLQSVRGDLLPLLVGYQYQPLEAVLEAMPALQYRNRVLAAMEPWMHSSTAALAQADNKHFEMIDFLAREFRTTGSFTGGLSTTLVPSSERARARSGSNLNKNRNEEGPEADEPGVGGATEPVSGMCVGEQGTGDSLLNGRPGRYNGQNNNMNGNSSLNMSMSMLTVSEAATGVSDDGALDPLGVSDVAFREPVVFTGKDGKSQYIGGSRHMSANKTTNSIKNMTERDLLRCFAMITDENGFGGSFNSNNAGMNNAVFGGTSSTQGFTTSSSKGNSASFVMSSASGQISTPSAAMSAAKGEGGQVPTAEPALVLRLTSIASYHQLNKDITQHSYDVKVTPWPRVQGYQKKEQSVIGENVTLADKVTVKACTIGHNVSVGSKTKLNNCIVMDNVEIADGVVLQNCVVCAGAKVGCSSNLNECNVGVGVDVPSGTRAKVENFAD